MTFTHVHVVKALVDVVEALVVGDKLVNPKSAVQVIVDDTWDLGSTLDTSKRGSFPDTTRNKLESADSAAK